MPLPRVLTSLLPRLQTLHLKVGPRGDRERERADNNEIAYSLGDCCCSRLTRTKQFYCFPFPSIDEALEATNKKISFKIENEIFHHFSYFFKQKSFRLTSI